MRTHEFITEGASSVLYHKTSIYAALTIIKNGEFQMSSTVGNPTEEALAPKGYPYYLSATRTKVGDYHRWVGSSAAMFVLDGNRISNNYRVEPVDYWYTDSRNIKNEFGQYPKWNEVNPEYKKSGWQHSPERTRESEDRIFGKTNTLSTDCVREIHVLIAEQDDRHSETARQLLIAAKTSGIATYLYNDAKAWRLQDTRKSITPGEAAELLRGHRREPPYMKRPNRGQGRGDDAYGRSNLLMWIELIKKKPGMPLSKGADKIRYNLQYYGDMSGQLKNDFFNAKKPDSPEYPLVVKLGDYLNKNNLTINDLTDRLKTKWAKPR